MELKVDRRTPTVLSPQFEGYPVVDNYRYLGVYLSENSSLETELTQKSLQKQKLAQSEWLLKSS